MYKCNSCHKSFNLSPIKREQLSKNDKEASSNVLYAIDPGSEKEIKILKDPTPEQAVNLYNSAKKEFELDKPTLRWGSDVNGHLYMWDAYYLLHSDALRQIPADFGYDPNTGILSTVDLAADWARRFQRDQEQRREEREYEQQRLQIQPAALSKKEINKQALRGPIFIWLAPDGKEFSTPQHSHGAWVIDNKEMLEKQYGLTRPAFDWGFGEDVEWLISKGWVRITGYLPQELDLDVADIKNIPEVAEHLVWREKPEIVIVEDLKGNDDSFDKEDYSKGLIKQADISGQIVNNILKLIQQTGGATYNLSKGNLAGQPYFAVAIYPDREEILEGMAGHDDLQHYLDTNQDLLNNSQNSFGAWTSDGKTYLDIVATVPTKEQALELGYKHRQLAIFDLKEMKEIPLQRTANLKQAAAVSDREQAKYYDEIYSDRWRDDSSKIDGGNEYYDWSELGSNDYPNPKDEEKEHALLDQLEKPVHRNFAPGIGEYAITFYDAYPNQGDQGGI
jgi:hypothetical protein